MYCVERDRVGRGWEETRIGMGMDMDMRMGIGIDMESVLYGKGKVDGCK